MERLALDTLRKFDAGECSLEETLDAVDSYDKFCDPRKNHRHLS